MISIFMHVVQCKAEALSSPSEISFVSVCRLFQLYPHVQVVQMICTSGQSSVYL